MGQRLAVDRRSPRTRRRRRRAPRSGRPRRAPPRPGAPPAGRARCRRGRFDRGARRHACEPTGMSDAQALRELEAAPLGLPAGLEVGWLGVSGYRLTYEGVSLFIDPYVSRVPLRAFLLRRTDAARRGADRALRDARPGRSPACSSATRTSTTPSTRRRSPARYGAKAYGSPSLAHLMRLHGLGDAGGRGRAPPAPTSSGPFVVRFVPSRHSKLLFGRKVPMDGPLTCEHLDGLAPAAYKCGAVYGIRIDVGGRLALPPGQRRPQRRELRDGPVDVFLAGVAGRSVTPRYWERILPRLDPQVVVPDPLRQLLLAARARAGLRSPGRPRRCARRGASRRAATRGWRRCRGSTPAADRCANIRSCRTGRRSSTPTPTRSTPRSSSGTIRRWPGGR